MNYEERINAVISRQTEQEMPQLAPVVAMFMKDFRPSAQQSGDNMTTAEIALALEDIAIINLNDIVDVMLYLGYSIVSNEIKGLEWGMNYVNYKE